MLKIIYRNTLKPIVTRFRIWLSVKRPYKPIHVSKMEWESDYASGRWDRLGDIEQLAHYSMIVGFCHHLKHGGAILDVGCGEGILKDRLHQGKYSRYVGIDISSKAISRASLKKDARSEFLVADADEFETEEAFDVVVFNECLYYLPDPIGTMRKYENCTRESGYFIVSIVDWRGTAKVWELLNREYVSEDEVTVLRRSANKSWTIKVFALNRQGRSNS